MTVDSHPVHASSHALFVNRHERRDGFWANIRGHVIDLADPTSGQALAPTPDDLFIASVASDLAWYSQSLLRGYGLPDDVSVSAKWQTPRGSAEITLTVTLSRRAAAVSAALAAALENRLAARSLANPVVHISCKE
jgi:hypothetical protein